MALQCCRHQDWLHGCWDLCDKTEQLGKSTLRAVFLPCFEALTGSTALGVSVLASFARVATLQRCVGSAGHISVTFCGLVPMA